MTLADPLGVAAFADQYKVADVKFALTWYQEMSATGGGDTLYADIAPPRWHADITTNMLLHADAEAVMALINSRAGGLKTFLLYNYRLPYPSSDPDGSIFGAVTPVVGTIADAYHLAFTGFPNGYVMPAGSFFQAIFGSTRYYLGQFAEARTADGSGNIASVEVAPALPASIIGGEAVTVKKAAGKFRIVPGSAAASVSTPTYSTIGFSADQTYAP